ncbi:MAG: hypothetical protein KBC84_02160, partial [Proteobacteria bacterium]|nr:hypothetical protein [Pseudomonadota bacterium]
MHRILLVIIILFSFSSCKLDPFETLAATENGIVFSKLPTFIGGGVHQKVYAPKQKILLMPWEQVYKLDTGLQTVSWGAKGEGDNSKVEDFVQTRALDGNEVSLTMTVSYRVMPEKVGYVIQKIGVTNEAVKQLVTVVARSDIRTYMNFLRTDDFSNSDERTKRVLQIKNAMNSRLQPEGIEIIDVLYVKRLFSKAMADGTLDTRYQDEINKTYR